MAKTLKEYLDEKLKPNDLRAPDRNPLVAPQADLAKKAKALLNKYETKKLGKIDSPWNRYGSGHSFGDLLFGESPELLDDMSHGLNPLAKGRTGRIPIPDKRLLDMPVPIPSTGGMGVIKKEGQNWLTGSVERALKGLKPEQGGPGLTATESYSKLKEIADRYRSQGLNDNARDLEQIMGTLAPKVEMENWIDGPLTKYIKNRMATPSDEVRKLADQGILHFTPEPLPSHNRIPVVNSRKEIGFPIDGMADNHITGTAWEDTADWMLLPERADEFVHEFTGNPNVYDEKLLAENPWLTKVDPSTPVHTLQPDALRYSGIPHLIDELLNAANPESGLPMNLRMKPEGFKGLSMEEAVKKVHGINQHRILQAEAARKQMSRAKGIATSKKYDDGFRFVAPDDVTKNPKHRDYVVDAGKRGAWCTQGDACDRYAGGNSRVEILLDDFGNPHAQIAIETHREYPDQVTWMNRAKDQGVPPELLNKLDYKLENAISPEEDFNESYRYLLDQELKKKRI
jgi:hypothetical protein